MGHSTPVGILDKRSNPAHGEINYISALYPGSYHWHPFRSPGTYLVQNTDHYTSHTSIHGCWRWRLGSEDLEIDSWSWSTSIVLNIVAGVEESVVVVNVPPFFAACMSSSSARPMGRVSSSWRRCPLLLGSFPMVRGQVLGIALRLLDDHTLLQVLMEARSLPRNVCSAKARGMDGAHITRLTEVISARYHNHTSEMVYEVSPMVGQGYIVL